jgi:hypothetical protein
MDNLTYQQRAIIACIRSQQGTPYLEGGDSPGGFDSSGLTKYCFGSAGIELPHSALEQSKLGEAANCTQATPGDLIFFIDEDEPNTGEINLVGTFDTTMGTVWMVVKVSADTTVRGSPDIFNNGYYAPRYQFCKRLWNDQLIRSTAPKSRTQSASPARSIYPTGTSPPSQKFTFCRPIYQMRRSFLRGSYFMMAFVGPKT